jgi:predicted TIM-barrel fold metal-dependent hydrolase
MTSFLSRRTFLGGAGGLGLETGQHPALPIIDTHIHLFDPRRPQGVPWPSKDNVVLYQPALPERLRRIAEPLGVKGAIEVECSPWPDDNQWVLDVAAKDTIIVGTVGNLEPGKPGFRRDLDRFRRNPLFRGIRYGYLWGRNLAEALSNAQFIDDLKLLAGAGLELDTANPSPASVGDVLRLSDRVPSLRIVMDHMPRLEPPAELSARKELQAHLRELGKRPAVYAKVSGVLRRVDGRVPQDLNFYRPRLDELWDTFGEDRLLYGSDWPNSDQWGTYEQGLRIVTEYFKGKGAAAIEKFFWKNSMAAYRWVKRDPTQPG